MLILKKEDKDLFFEIYDKNIGFIKNIKVSEFKSIY